MSLSSKLVGLRKDIKEKKIELTKPEVRKSPEKVKVIRKELKDLTDEVNNIREFHRSSEYRNALRDAGDDAYERWLIKKENLKFKKFPKPPKPLSKWDSISLTRINKEELNRIKRKLENYHDMNLRMNCLITNIIYNFKHRRNEDDWDFDVIK